MLVRMFNLDAVVLAQATWLTLCSMMLFSRFIFQAQGAAGMRLFLDTWKDSTTHRIWGWAALAAGIALAATSLLNSAQPSWRDSLVVWSVVVILCADGMLNLFPSWFGHFKERMQAAWVRRHGTSTRAADSHLFGTVNFILGAASIIVGLAVYLHRPMRAAWLAGSLGVALLMTMLLVFACQAEGRRRIERAG